MVASGAAVCAVPGVRGCQGGCAVNALVKLEGAVRMLAEAGTLEEVKHVHDLAILPACPGVYIVFDDAAVLYVGRSNNIKGAGKDTIEPSR